MASYSFLCATILNTVISVHAVPEGTRSPSDRSYWIIPTVLWFIVVQKNEAAREIVGSVSWLVTCRLSVAQENLASETDVMDGNWSRQDFVLDLDQSKNVQCCAKLIAVQYPSIDRVLFAPTELNP